MWGSGSICAKIYPSVLYARSTPDLPSRAYCLDSALRSASMRLVRMSLMRVRCPSPFDFSHSRTRGSSRTLTGANRREAAITPNKQGVFETGMQLCACLVSVVRCGETV
jgi:hypothetical protein